MKRFLLLAVFALIFVGHTSAQKTNYVFDYQCTKYLAEDGGWNNKGYNTSGRKYSDRIILSFPDDESAILEEQGRHYNFYRGRNEGNMKTYMCPPPSESLHFFVEMLEWEKFTLEVCGFGWVVMIVDDDHSCLYIIYGENAPYDTYYTRSDTYRFQYSTHEPARPARPAPVTHGNINGYEWVDLGLPSGLKWATCNVGGAQPEDCGEYYAWGEVNTKNEYTKENSSMSEKSTVDISGNPQYDVARTKWGGSWRMPTEEEWDELFEECSCAWTKKGGQLGLEVKGSNGNAIFLPAAGVRYNADINDKGEIYYWTSTPMGDRRHLFAFRREYRISFTCPRYFGLCVRPVSD